jgi:hypothetical protein
MMVHSEPVAHSNGAPLAVQDQRMALEPSNFEEGMRLAQVVAKSGMFGIKSEADAFVRISTGVALGMNAVQSLRGIHVINGKPGLAADLMMGLCLQSPDCQYFRMVESTNDSATFETKRRSGPTPTRLSFTMADATRAELTSSPMYKKYPAQMLRARCIAALARLVFPERCHGLYTPDELRDGKTVEGDIPEEEYAVTVAPMPPAATAKAAAKVAEATKGPDYNAIGVELETKLNLAESLSDVAALSSEYQPRFKGASADLKARIRALFTAARARLTPPTENLDAEPPPEAT